MSLADRVKAAKATDTTDVAQRDEVREELRRKLHFKVVEGLGPTLYDRQMSDAELKLRVMEMLEWALDQEESVPLSRADRLQLLQEICLRTEVADVSTGHLCLPHGRAHPAPVVFVKAVPLDHGRRKVQTPEDVLECSLDCAGPRSRGSRYRNNRM